MNTLEDMKKLNGKLVLVDWIDAVGAMHVLPEELELAEGQTVGWVDEVCEKFIRIKHSGYIGEDNRGDYTMIPSPWSVKLTELKPCK